MFKVGDWVHIPNEFGDLETYKLRYEDFHGISRKNSQWFSILQHWKPKKDEWCWFWNKDQLKYNGSPEFGKYGVLSYTEEFYEHIEPFIGQLPSFCKGD